MSLRSLPANAVGRAAVLDRTELLPRRSRPAWRHQTGGEDLVDGLTVCPEVLRVATSARSQVSVSTRTFASLHNKKPRRVGCQCRARVGGGILSDALTWMRLLAIPAEARQLAYALGVVIGDNIPKVTSTQGGPAGADACEETVGAHRRSLLRAGPTVAPAYVRRCEC